MVNPVNRMVSLVLLLGDCSVYQELVFRSSGVSGQSLAAAPILGILLSMHLLLACSLVSKCQDCKTKNTQLPFSVWNLTIVKSEASDAFVYHGSIN